MRRILLYRTFLVVFVLMGVAQFAYPQRQVSIQQAIQQVLDNNLQLKQAEYQKSLSELDLRQSKMNFYPNLQAGASANRNWGLSFDQTAGRLATQSVNSAGAQLSSSFDIFQGFQKVNQVRLNRYQLAANESQVDRVRNDLTLAVVTNYLDALASRDMYEASVEQHQLSQAQLEAMEIKVEAGNNTLADLAQARAQLANDELNSTTALNAYELSVLNLKQLMEWDPTVEITLVRPSIDATRLSTTRMDAASIYEIAAPNYAEIKVAEFQTQAAEQSIALAKAGLYPSLSINAGIGTNYSSQAIDFTTGQLLPFGEQLSRNRGQSVGLSLGIPIFNQSRTRIAISRAKVNYESAKSNEQLARNNFNKIIHQAVLDLRSAEKRLSASELAFSAAEEAFEVLRLRFEEGLANSIELATSQTNRNRAEFELIQARYDLIFRSKVIDYYLGDVGNWAF